MSELDLIFNRKKKEESIKEEDKKPEIEQKVEEKKEESKPEGIKAQSNVEEIMRKFIEKDPKIGIWSYPAYLLLQYLYNTIPGFKMSKTAKEALERGLKEMYPDLFQIAEKVAKESGKI
ncbi:hypothetical protein SJAV_06370 [Sulfurisphaera javensis]|uniref:Uncharacterized protein n=1 Tax=Sulfurisphaera javensis TaxID=2049879 RepID=A0AAT9GPA3_9CREN